MSAPNVLGLDLGLARAGAARIRHNTDRHRMRIDTWPLRTHSLGPMPPIGEVARRVRRVAAWAVSKATSSTVLVVVEGPALDAEHGLPHERAGAWWLAVDNLCRYDIPVAVLQPATAKKNVTGNGRADKDDVQRAVHAAWPGRGLDRVSHDECDAVALAQCGVAWLGWPGPWLDGHPPLLSRAGRWPDMPGRRP